MAIDIANLPAVWNKVVAEAKTLFADQLSLYEALLVPTKPHDVIGDSLVVFAERPFDKSTLNDSWRDKLSDLLKSQTGEDLKVLFVVPGEEKVLRLTNNQDYVVTKPVLMGIRKDQTFNELVVGDFNRSAVTAAKEVAEKPGAEHNPLFVYGNTGLGKSHLLNAIGIAYSQKFPARPVRLINSEDFMREYVTAATQGGESADKFKRGFDNFGLLLIDDIQLLASRVRSGEALFGVLENFLKEKKQLVIASDKKPEDLDGFEGRMITRFGMGLTVRIKKPETNALHQIASVKASLRKNEIELTEDAIDFLISTNVNDIRTLEGRLNQVAFNAKGQHPRLKVIDATTCASLLGDVNHPSLFGDESGFSADRTIAKICTSYGVSEDLVRSQSRTALATKVRQICMYVLRQKGDMSYGKIGAEFSNRDHSTVMSSIEKVASLMKTDPELKAAIRKFTEG